MNTFSYKLTYSFLDAWKGIGMASESNNKAAENLGRQYLNFIVYRLSEIGNREKLTHYHAQENMWCESGIIS